MKLVPLLEADEQDRKDLLKWQEKLINAFPDSYDVGLAVRAPYTNQTPINVVTVARNGKELFYFDTRRSSIDFYSTMNACGDHVRSFSINVKNLQKSINDLMLMYEFQRKISNLLSDAKCIIDKDRNKANTLVIEIASKIYGHSNGTVYAEYNHVNNIYRVVIIQSLRNIQVIGTSKDMGKAIDFVEKAFKSLSE